MEPLSTFEPMVEEVFGRTAYAADVIKEGEITNLPSLLDAK